jgi:hypothetical protein
MKDEPVSWGIALRVYWLIAWRTLAMYLLPSVPFNLWLMLTERLNDDSYFVPRLALALLWPVGAGFIAVRMALRKRYRGFKIQIIREEPASNPLSS